MNVFPLSRDFEANVLLGLVYECRTTEECFNDWGGRGYDDSVPGEVTKTTPSWSASLPQVRLISRGGWSNKSPGGAIL